MTCLTDGGVPVAGLQVRGNAIGVLKVADVGDLAGGEAAPEAEQFFFENQVGNVEIGQVLVLFESEAPIEQDLNEHEGVVGDDYLSGARRALKCSDDEAVAGCSGKVPPAHGPRGGGKETDKKDDGSGDAPNVEPRTAGFGRDGGNYVDIGRGEDGDGNIELPEGGGGDETKLGDVGAGREVDAKFRVGSGVAVVLEEALADIARRDANDGVIGGVIGGGPAEQCDSDAAFAKVGRVTVEREFDDVLQEGLAAVATFESGSVDDLIEMRSQLRFMSNCLADLGDCR